MRSSLPDGLTNAVVEHETVVVHPPSQQDAVTEIGGSTYEDALKPLQRVLVPDFGKLPKHHRPTALKYHGRQKMSPSVIAEPVFRG